jgi:hypothetical protein
MRVSLSVLCMICALACGGDDDGGESPAVDAAGQADAANSADAAAGLAGGYVRVIPGYDTEEECRKENPDKLFACLELVSLCPDDVAYILFTDIVFDADWSEDGDSALLTFETWDEAFADDGMTTFVKQEDGTIESAQVYGDKAFELSTRDQDSLCP